MELDERKRRILKIIADLYTKTGEPVGSKVVAPVSGQRLLPCHHPQRYGRPV